MKNNRIWVVEIATAIKNNKVVLFWSPTVGAALNRADGREKLKDWRTRNPCDRFRLVRYERLQEVGDD